MSNEMRHRKEEPKQKMFAVDSAQVIEIGDFTWLNTDDVRAASDYTWDSDLATTQRSFVKLCAGVSGDQSESGDTDEVAIETGGIVEMDCAAAQFEISDLVGLAKALGNNLEDQKVVAVASHDLAIGKVTQRYTTNTTTVYLEIFPRISQSLMTSDQIIDEINNNTGFGAVMDTDFALSTGFMRKVSTGVYIAHKSNLAAAVAPTVTDDSDSDYSVGSVWANTTADEVYVCIDASVGAAVWNVLVTAAEKAKLVNLGVDKLFVENYTAVAGDDTTGYYDCDTGFGVAPDGWNVQVYRAGVDVKNDAIITALGGGDAGKIRVADGGATYAVTANDVIMLMAWDKS